MLYLRIDNVTLGYGKQIVLHNVDFRAGPGEMLGIIGPNGSGKSTLIRGLTRIITPSCGDVFIDGSNLNRISPQKLAQIVGVVPQNPALPETFTAFEVVLMGRTPHLGLLRYESVRDLDIVRNAMAATRTLDLSKRRVSELSGGERQRLTIARALAQEPKILLMDEPTANLDINYQMETLELARQLSRYEELIVVVTLHDLNLAAQYCDKLILLSNGTIHCQGSPQEVINARTIKDVYGAQVCVYPHPVNKLPATLVVSDKEKRAQSK